MHALLDRGRHDLRRCQPDALVDHLEPDVAGAHGHLLGPVGVPVQPRLADEHAQPLVQLVAGRADPGPTVAISPAASPETAAATPVGARNSPNTSRSAPVHSPVVTPALAHAIEASMRFVSVLAASRRLSSAASTAAASRPDRHARIASTAAASIAGSTTSIAPAPSACRGLGSVVEPVHPDDHLVARLMPPPGAASERTSSPFM